MNEQVKKWKGEYEQVFNGFVTPQKWVGFLAAKRQDAERIAELGATNKIHEDYIAMAKNTESFLRQQQMDSNKSWNTQNKELLAKLEAVSKERDELAAMVEVVREVALKPPTNEGEQRACKNDSDSSRSA